MKPAAAEAQARQARWIELIHCDNQWRVIEFLRQPSYGWIARSEWTDREIAEAIRDALQPRSLP